VLAVKAGHRSKLIEVKSDKAGPWAHYGPALREAHLDYCERHDLEAVMAWVRLAHTRYMEAEDWPERKEG